MYTHQIFNLATKFSILRLYILSLATILKFNHQIFNLAPIHLQTIRQIYNLAPTEYIFNLATNSSI